MLDSKQSQIAEAARLPIPTTQAIIDGKLTGAVSGKTLAVVSPIDGETIAAIPDCEKPDVDRAVSGARRAFEVALLARHEPQTAQAHSARLGKSR